MSTLGIAGFASYSSLIENRWVDISFHTLRKNISKGIRIVQLADLHMGSQATDYNLIARLVNELQPDIILNTGDTFDDKNDIDGYMKFIKKLPKVPKYAIVGNWDFEANWGLENSIDYLQDTDWTVLRNSALQFECKGTSFNLYGLDDSRQGNPLIRHTLNSLSTASEAQVSICLTHCPVEFHRLAFLREKGNLIPKPDIVLAGHTHGGQINFFGFTPILPLGSGGFRNGFYQLADLTMYVSRGLGTTRIPFRFMSRPEIAVFDIM